MITDVIDDKIDAQIFRSGEYEGFRYSSRRFWESEFNKCMVIQKEKHFRGVDE